MTDEERFKRLENLSSQILESLASHKNSIEQLIDFAKKTNDSIQRLERIALINTYDIEDINKRLDELEEKKKRRMH